MTTPADDRYDVAVVGGGSAAETLVAELDGSGMRVVVFELSLVGGECPFLACMPSKSMLHEAAVGTSWADAVARRDRVTERRDDTGHARRLEAAGARLVRSRARLTGPDTLRADDGTEVTATHVVLATGSKPLVPDLDGDARLWTSDDALVAVERPDSLLIIGAGVIGCELAQLFAGFGTTVTVVGRDERLFPDLEAPVGDIVASGLAAAGVELVLGRVAVAATTDGEGTVVTLDDGRELRAERVLTAIGQRPATDGLGLDAIGRCDGEPLDVAPDGRVPGPGSVWAIGDVAGVGEYTHLANHHARVVAANLRGGARRFDDAVLPRCVFVRPPVFVVGPTPAEVFADPQRAANVVWRSSSLRGFPRAITDRNGTGHLAIAADRTTRTVVAAHGVGPGFDELVHAITVAIDGRVPLDVLARCIQPFPTLGEVLGVVFGELLDAVGPS